MEQSDTEKTEEQKEAEQAIVEWMQAKPGRLARLVAASSSHTFKMLANRFDKLLNDLFAERYSLMLQLCQNAAPADQQKLSVSLVRVLEAVDFPLCFFEVLLSSEIELTVQETTLFRTNSMATKMLSKYAHTVGEAWLVRVLKPNVEQLLVNPLKFEVDPARVADGHTPEEGLMNLEHIATTFLQSVQVAALKCPVQLRALCQKLYRLVDIKFPSSTKAKENAVGGFLFLRFICPSIMTPHMYGIVDKPPERLGTRALTLVAKVLQNLANGVEFGSKEAYMKDLNVFVQTNLETMTKLYDTLAGADSMSDVGDDVALSMETTFIEPATLEDDLVLLHRLSQFRDHQMVHQQSEEDKHVAKNFLLDFLDKNSKAIESSSRSERATLGSHRIDMKHRTIDGSKAAEDDELAAEREEFAAAAQRAHVKAEEQRAHHMEHRQTDRRSGIGLGDAGLDLTVPTTEEEMISAILYPTNHTQAKWDVVHHSKDLGISVLKKTDAESKKFGRCWMCAVNCIDCSPQNLFELLWNDKLWKVWDCEMTSSRTIEKISDTCTITKVMTGGTGQHLVDAKDFAVQRCYKQMEDMFVVASRPTVHVEVTKEEHPEYMKGEVKCVGWVIRPRRNAEGRLMHNKSQAAFVALARPKGHELGASKMRMYFTQVFTQNLLPKLQEKAHAVTYEQERTWLQEEDDDEITFGAPPDENSYPLVKSATIDKLIERLTYDRYFDQKFVETFMLTSRSFIKADELLSKLQYRYLKASETAGHDGGDGKKDAAVIQLRTSNVLKMWVGHYFWDFKNDEDLIEHFYQVVNDTIGEGNKLAVALVQLMQKEIEKVREHHSTTCELFQQGKDHIPRMLLKQGADLSMEKISHVTLAEQLTALEHEVYRAIMPNELLKLGWSKKDKDKRSPNVLFMIHRFNFVSNWVVSELVKVKSLKARADMMRKFIKIAKHCRRLKNFNAVMEIVAGLQNSSVYRLKKTWAHLTKQKREDFEELKQFTSTDQNYKQFREYMKGVEPPCVPYLGVYLTDLTFIEDGIPDKVKHQKADGTTVEQVNFDKNTKVSHVIHQIQLYQRDIYASIEPISEVQVFLLVAQIFTENEAYKMSLEVEPREPS